jgi:hypothetical protein
MVHSAEAHAIKLPQKVGIHRPVHIKNLEHHSRSQTIAQTRELLEAETFLSSQVASREIPCLLWYPKFNYRVHKSPPQSSILSHMNPVHTFIPYFWSSTSIWTSHQRLGLWSLPFMLSGSHFVCTSRPSHSYYMSHPPLPRSYHFIT